MSELDPLLRSIAFDVQSALLDTNRYDEIDMQVAVGTYEKAAIDLIAKVGSYDDRLTLRLAVFQYMASYPLQHNGRYVYRDRSVGIQHVSYIWRSGAKAWRCEKPLLEHCTATERIDHGTEKLIAVLAQAGISRATVLRRESMTCALQQLKHHHEDRISLT